jgi:hypothetical protein
MANLQDLFQAPAGVGISLPTLKSVTDAIANLPLPDRGTKTYDSAAQTPEALLKAKQPAPVQLPAINKSIQDAFPAQPAPSAASQETPTQKHVAEQAHDKAQEITEGVKDQLRYAPPDYPAVNPVEEIKKIYGAPEDPTSGTAKAAPGQEDAYHKQYLRFMTNPDIAQFNRLMPINKIPDVLDTLNYLDTGPSSAALSLKNDIHNEMLNQIPNYVPEAAPHINAINALMNLHRAATDSASKTEAVAPVSQPPVATTLAAPSTPAPETQAQPQQAMADAVQPQQAAENMQQGNNLKILMSNMAPPQQRRVAIAGIPTRPRTGTSIKKLSKG